MSAKELTKAKSHKQSKHSAKLQDCLILLLSYEFKLIPANMPREADLSNVEKAFILEALTQNVRLDGRAQDQFRNLDFSFDDDYGICSVQLGKTKYVSPA